MSRAPLCQGTGAAGIPWNSSPEPGGSGRAAWEGSALPCAGTSVIALSAPGLCSARVPLGAQSLPAFPASCFSWLPLNCTARPAGPSDVRASGSGGRNRNQEQKERQEHQEQQEYQEQQESRSCRNSRNTRNSSPMNTAGFSAEPMEHAMGSVAAAGAVPGALGCSSSGMETEPATLP